MAECATENDVRWSHLDIRVIDRILRWKRKLRFKSQGNKEALVSYVLFPPYLSEAARYFNSTHTNRWVAKIFVETLVELGYNVTLHSYLDEEIDFSPNYDVFFGHNRTFHKIAEKLRNKTQKVLLTTGCHPAYDNNQLLKRYQALTSRRPSTEALFTPIAEVDYPYLNFKIADWVYMIAAEPIVAHTWFQEFQDKFVSYNNLSIFQPKLRRKAAVTDFVYFSSVGNLRRGLDLVLEAFKELPQYRVYICGPYEKESNFCRLYKKELYETPNIVPLGLMDTSSKRFRRLMDQVGFLVMPSCSEGQSGSVLNLMSLGVLPIITPECGFLNIEDFGFEIAAGDLPAVKNAILRGASLSAEERISKQKKLFLKSFEHTPPVLKKSFINFILNCVEKV